MSPLHEKIIERFTKACRADERVVACFLGGSYARGTADAYSDLDLYLITTDAAHERFCAGREAFLQRLDEPLFVEHFNFPNLVFFILADGMEGELGIGKASDFGSIHSGPYIVLLDKADILQGVDFPETKPAAQAQTETLRRIIYWFWHDLSHLNTAIARGQLWWAYGQLEILRGSCVRLARLEHDFLDADVGDEPYFKVDKAMDVDTLAELQETFCPMERNAMLQAARAVLGYFKAHAPALAARHNIPYPTRLEQVMTEEFERATTADNGRRGMNKNGVSS